MTAASALHWTRLHKLGKLWPAAYPGDAGLDLTSVENVDLSPANHGHGVIQVACGIQIALPEGVAALVVGRSSSALNNLLVVNTLIDTGYRGPLFVFIINLNPLLGAKIEAGDRIAQLVPLLSLAGRLSVSEVDRHTFENALPKSARGQNGFGSSGGVMQREDKYVTQKE